MTSLFLFFFCVACPQTCISILSSCAFQAGYAAIINCCVMAGKFSQHYSVQWEKGRLTIAFCGNYCMLFQGVPCFDILLQILQVLQFFQSQQ